LAVLKPPIPGEPPFVVWAAADHYVVPPLSLLIRVEEGLKKVFHILCPFFSINTAKIFRFPAASRYFFTSGLAFASPSLAWLWLLFIQRTA
jgi:hypothetical protein